MPVNTAKRPETGIAAALLWLAGQDNYCAGIPPDCGASGDPGLATGYPAESMLPGAQYFIDNQTLAGGAAGTAVRTQVVAGITAC